MNDLFMDGMAIFNFAITEVHKNVNSLIEYMDWVKEDVGFYALHQANEFMVNYVRKKLKVAAEVAPCQLQGLWQYWTCYHTISAE